MDDDIIVQYIEYKPVLKMLKREALLESSKGDFSHFTYLYFKNILSEAIKSKVNVSKRIRLSMFLDYFIKFHLLGQTIKQNLEDVSKYTGIPPFFLKYFIDNFTDTTYNLSEIRYIKTDTFKLKTVYYIIVIAFILYDFETFDIAPLAKSMKIETKQMFNYCKEIGCNFSNAKGDDSTETKIRGNQETLNIRLKAPLKIRLDRYAVKNSSISK